MNELNIDFSSIKMNTVFKQISSYLFFIVNPKHYKTKGRMILLAFKFRISVT